MYEMGDHNKSKDKTFIPIKVFVLLRVTNTVGGLKPDYPSTVELLLENETDPCR